MAECAYESFGNAKSLLTPNPPELDGVPDMSMLIHLEGGNIVHNLQCRYKKDQIYTAMSKVLIAVNPYHTIDIYSPKNIQKYHENTEGFGALPPHIFAVAAESYRGLLERGCNQSMIVCGESGSGKTENAKFLMRHLAYTTPTGDLTGNPDVDRRINRSSSVSVQEGTMMIEQQILAANPILEAFGNAKTVLNNNSSRFGKFTKMLFTTEAHKEGKIVGSYIETYLLEKSRVVCQPKDERNFHIFYQMIKGLSESKLNELGCKSARQFHYLNQWRCEEIPGVSDKGRFHETIAGMEMLGMHEDIQNFIWSILAGICHIGNVELVADPQNQENAVLKDATSIKEAAIAAKLLGVDEKDINTRLLTRSIRVRGNVIVKPLTVDDAIKNRDAVAKGLFSSLFDWVVTRINKVLFDEQGQSGVADVDSHDFKADWREIDSGDDEDANDSRIRFIGILDVFGFECFLHNSFEQFCINFANERLQNFFNEHIIRSEQEEYLKEGIFWTPVEVPDNSDTIELVCHKTLGIYAILEAACNQPGGNDDIFTQNLFESQKNHRRLKRERHATTRKNKSGQMEVINGFSLQHFAGKVIYNAKEFLVKNTDRTHPDTIIMMSRSSNLVAKEVLGPPPDPGSRRKTAQTVGGQFEKQLENLMNHLLQTYPFFIRCVNPNDRKQPHHFISQYVEHQLRCGGLIEALRILKCGYPTRASYVSLWQRYGHLLQPAPSHINYRDFCEAILVSYGLGSEHYELGLTKVFFRPAKQSFLEDILKRNRFSLPPEMLAKIKKYLSHKRVIRLGALMAAYGRFSLRHRRLSSQKRLAHIVRVSCKMQQSMIKLLSYVRTRSACVAIQAGYRMVLQLAWTSRTLELLKITQIWYRHQYRKRMLKGEIDKRIGIRRAKMEQAALEETERRRLEAQRLAAEKREQATRAHIQKVKTCGSVYSAILGEIAIFYSDLLGEIIDSRNFMSNVTTGVILIRGLKKLEPNQQLKIHTKATPGTFFARDNITNFLISLPKAGVNQAVICEADVLINNSNEQAFLTMIINYMFALNQRSIHKPSHKTYRFQVMMELCEAADSPDGIVCFGPNGIFEDFNMDRQIKEQFLQGRRAALITGRDQVSSSRFEDDNIVLSSETKAVVDYDGTRSRRRRDDSDDESSKLDDSAVLAAKQRIKDRKSGKERVEEKEEEEPKKTKKSKKKHRKSETETETETESDESTPTESEDSDERRRRRRKHRKHRKHKKKEKESLPSEDIPMVGTVQPGVDPMEQFFCMTHAAVLTKLEEEGTLDDFNLSSSKELFALAKSQNVGWHEWHDWLKLQLSAVFGDEEEDDIITDGSQEEQRGRSYSVDDMELLDEDIGGGDLLRNFADNPPKQQPPNIWDGASRIRAATTMPAAPGLMRAQTTMFANKGPNIDPRLAHIRRVEDTQHRRRGSITPPPFSRINHFQAPRPMPTGSGAQGQEECIIL